MPIMVGGLQLIHTFYVLSCMSTNTSVIIGLDFFKAHRASLDWVNNVLKIQDGLTEVAFNEPHEPQSLFRRISHTKLQIGQCVLFQ